MSEEKLTEYKNSLVEAYHDLYWATCCLEDKPVTKKFISNMMEEIDMLIEMCDHFIERTYGYDREVD